MKRYRKVSVGYFETNPRSRELIKQALDTGRISYGPLCQQLEEYMADKHDTSYGVLSASGTDSLRAALHAMKLIHGWQDGDEIITAATTFVATVNIILQVGLKPVLVDVMPNNYTLDYHKLPEAITKRTRAIIPVNLLGQAADLMHIVSIAQDYDLQVIEDSCEAMFVKHMDMPVGSWGDIGCFSFYMAHLVTAGVGGIAITDNEEYADVMRSLLNHGRDTIYISIDDDDDISGEDMQELVGRRFRFVTPGYSSRMTELQAALAIPQVEEWEEMIEKRRQIAGALTRRLSKHRQLNLPKVMEHNTHSWMMYGLSVNEPSKWPLIAHLEENGIETRELLPLINQPVYRKLFNRDDFPVSNEALNKAFYIGCHQGMTEDDVEYGGEIVDYFYGG